MKILREILIKKCYKKTIENHVWISVALISHFLSKNQKDCLQKILANAKGNFIAEKLKIMGIQGIKYPSVLSESGYNICLFLPDKAEFKISEVINVKGVSYTFK